MARESKRAFLFRQVMEQRHWIEEHGRSLAGYVERYGSGECPACEHTRDEHRRQPNGALACTHSGCGCRDVEIECHGSGGEAIYAADSGALRKLEAALARLGG